MKSLIFALAVSFIVSLCFTHSIGQSSSRPDFSGIWIFNEAESNGNGTNLSSNNEVVTEIVHKDPEFRIITRNIANNSIESEVIFYTDNRGEVSSKKRESKTKWDGRKIVTKTKDNTKTEWSLSADGNTLTEKIKITLRTDFVVNGQIRSSQESSRELLKVYSRESKSSQTFRTQPVQQIDIEVLLSNLENPSDDVAMKAGLALTNMGRTVLPALLEGLKQRKGCRFQFVASGVVSQLEPSNEVVIPTLVEITKGNCKGAGQELLVLRRNSAMVLAAKTEGIPVIVELLKDKDPFNRRSAVFAFDELTERIEDMRPDKITPTPEMLAAIQKAIPPLVDAMSDKDEIVYCMAYESLDQLRRSMHAELRSLASSRMQGVKVKCTK